MNKLITALKGECSPGIYHLTTAVQVDELSCLLKEHDYQLFYIDGREVASKAAFLKAAALAMKFPVYFGYNWDAFEECITDLEWCPASRYVLLYDQPENFAENEPSQWKVAMDILQSSVEYWKETETPMYVLLRGPDTTTAGLKVL